jgi:DNA-binding MarR family transcriptional regulator
MSLRAEIKQAKPFRSVEEEVFLNILRTADALRQGELALFKSVGLSPSQYNLLRILRGAGAEGLACQEIGERMISRDPDVTRLLDRLEARALVTRSRQQSDRRVVTARITEKGLDLLQRLDEPVIEVHRRQLSHLGRDQLQKLVELLEAARENLGRNLEGARAGRTRSEEQR